MFVVSRRFVFFAFLFPESAGTFSAGGGREILCRSESSVRVEGDNRKRGELFDGFEREVISGGGRSFLT